MSKFKLNLIIGILIILSATSVCAQPIDLLIPGTNSPDTLSDELRGLQALERDIAIEKLTQPTTRLEAYIELGELRRSQGKLQEAERFFKMALEMQPKNLKANQGLTMVYYQRGQFHKARETMENLHQFYPLSDNLKYQLENAKAKLTNETQIGITVLEDDRGYSEQSASIEAFFPSYTYKKLSGRYRFETKTHKLNDSEVDSKVFAATFDYKFNQNNSLSMTYAPETFAGRETIGGYDFQLISGTDNLQLMAAMGNQAFKENFFTVQNQMSEKDYSLALFGNLHQRTRIIQTVTVSDISDGNARRKYDSELLYFIYRRGAPFLSVDLKISQASYEHQLDEQGQPYNYWSPSDFKSTELTLSWERSIGSNWWYGMDASLINNAYRDNNSDTKYEKGAGLLLHASYRLPKGRIFASLGEKVHDYYRERRLEVYGSLQF